MNTLGENSGGFTESPDATELRVQAGQNLLIFPSAGACQNPKKLEHGRWTCSCPCHSPLWVRCLHQWTPSVGDELDQETLLSLQDSFFLD